MRLVLSSTTCMLRHACSHGLGCRRLGWRGSLCRKRALQVAKGMWWYSAAGCAGRLWRVAGLWRRRLWYGCLSISLASCPLGAALCHATVSSRGGRSLTSGRDLARRRMLCLGERVVQQVMTQLRATCQCIKLLLCHRVHIGSHGLTAAV